MTETPNTAAIRAEAKRVATSANVTWVRLAFDLCDALDAARAEASGWKMCANHRGELLTEALRMFDAAEAQYAELERAELVRDELWAQDKARAEAAEAERDDLRREGDWRANQAWARCSHAHKAAEVAEARITAALAWFADTDCTWTYRVEMARRALTEGTGQ